jgi:hypothetical protein
MQGSTSVGLGPAKDGPYACKARYRGVLYPMTRGF